LVTDASVTWKSAFTQVSAVAAPASAIGSGVMVMTLVSVTL